MASDGGVSHANSNASPNDLNAIPEEGEEDSNTDQKEDEDCEDEEEEEVESGDDDSSSSSQSSDDEDNMMNNENDAVQSCSPTKAKFVKCPEDDEFQKEFDKLMTESIMSRNTDSVKPLSEIMIPVDYQNTGSRGGNHNSHKQDHHAPAVPYADSIAFPGPESTMNLTVMTRSGKGSNMKPVLKVVRVPLDSDLAKELMEKEAKHRREKEELKHLTLVMNDRIDEAEANQSGIPGPGNSYMKNRNHRHFHAKGAPDVDLIFGANATAAAAAGSPAPAAAGGGSNDGIGGTGSAATSGSTGSAANPSSGQRYQWVGSRFKRSSSSSF